MGDLVYYSSVSGNTKRFIENTGLSSIALSEEGDTTVSLPYILAFPSYAGGGPAKDAIPVPVKRFLNNPENRALLRGVIAFGNRNFGDAYCLGGRMVATKCGVPLLYRVEISGTPHDVRTVTDGVTQFWKQSK